MAKSECYCRFHSCEPLTVRIKDGHTEDCFTVSTNKRFCFNKENNAIIGGGVVPHDIPTCRVKEQHGVFQDKPFNYKETQPLNHQERRNKQRHNL